MPKRTSEFNSNKLPPLKPRKACGKPPASTKFTREITRRYPDATITATACGHLRLAFDDGAIVIASAREGSWRTLKNIAATVRRARREQRHHGFKAEIETVKASGVYLKGALQ